MTRTTKTALALCVVLLGSVIEAQADCQYVRGSISETRISIGTEPTRVLGTVTGVLNGAATVTLLSTVPPVRSLDIFVTKSGDVLRFEGVPTRTAVPGEPGEFITQVKLTFAEGSGQYEGASGTMDFDGLSHNAAVPPNSEFIYKGTVCGPNVKGDGN